VQKYNISNADGFGSSHSKLQVQSKHKNRTFHCTNVAWYEYWGPIQFSKSWKKLCIVLYWYQMLLRTNYFGLYSLNGRPSYTLKLFSSRLLAHFPNIWAKCIEGGHPADLSWWFSEQNFARKWWMFLVHLLFCTFHRLNPVNIETRANGNSRFRYRCKSWVQRCKIAGVSAYVETCFKTFN